MQNSTCAIKSAPTPIKKESKLRRVVRKVVESVKPTHCSVRYDADKSMWAEVDVHHDAKPIRHFTHGVIENVTLSSQKVNIGSGCGSHTSSVGIATGDLRSEVYSQDIKGFHNLAFNGTNFVNEDGQELTKANTILLLSDRRAMYR